MITQPAEIAFAEFFICDSNCSSDILDALVKALMKVSVLGLRPCMEV